MAVCKKNVFRVFVLLLCMCVSVVVCEDTFDYQPAISFDHSKRHSSYPFLSSDTFRSIANHHIDETKQRFDPQSVAQGDIIYVRAYPQFLDKLVASLAQITNQFILLTHSSDATMPGSYSFLLDNPLLIAWFAENKGPLEHEKLIAIPIGLADPYWPHGDVRIISDAMATTRNTTKKHFLYINFETGTNPKARINVFQSFRGKSFCYEARRKPWGEYLRDLAASRFILSPPGNGVDCHRPWEALLMGSIPVMITSSIDCLFDDLPVVIVQDWTQVTKEFLEKKYKEIREQTYNLKKLYADYWFDKIKTIQSHAQRG